MIRHLLIKNGLSKMFDTFVYKNQNIYDYIGYDVKHIICAKEYRYIALLDFDLE